MTLVVNGQQIDDAVIEGEFSGIKSYHESLGNVSCCERDPEFRASARENVVGRALLTQEAERVIDPPEPAQIEAAVEKLKAEYGGEGWFFARTGASADSMHVVRRNVDLELRVQKLLEKLANDGGPPTEAELLEAYQQNAARFMTAEEVRASHILRTGGGLGPDGIVEGRDKAYDRLRSVRKALLAGADFDQSAKEHSERAVDNVDNGENAGSIDLGFFKRNELAPEFETVAFSMEVGEISPVFVSPFGYHVAKLTDRKPSVPRPFSECREEVEKMFLDLRRQERAAALVEKLKSVATIEDVADQTADEPLAEAQPV